MKIPTLEEYKQLNGYRRLKIREYMRSQGMQPLHARTGVPGPLLGRSMPPRGPMPPRPHIWKVGPDEYRHLKFVAYGRHKAQAQFRGEDYQMSFEDFETAWGENYKHRGRGAANLVMVRIDEEKAWHINNVELIDRMTLLKRNGARRRLAHS